MKISKLTESVLALSPLARNSDKELHIAVLIRLGAELTPKTIEILRSYSFESVRRTRQKLQEQGKYLADKKVALERRMKGYEAQQNMPTTKPENVDLFTEQPHAISWLED